MKALATGREDEQKCETPYIAIAAAVAALAAAALVYNHTATASADVAAARVACAAVAAAVSDLSGEMKRLSEMIRANLKSDTEPTGPEIPERIQDPITDQLADIKANVGKLLELIPPKSEPISVPTVVVAQTEFSVILADYGPDKITIIKLVREIKAVDGAPLGLPEAKILVESAPCTIKERVSREDAEAIKTQFDGAGATVEIRRMQLVPFF